jgi:hypothetical protein
MSAAKHTPALQKRWKVTNHRMVVTDDPGCLLICEVFSGGIGVEEADRVQRAIAALPELLTALLKAWDYVLILGSEEEISQCRAALVAAGVDPKELG